MNPGIFREYDIRGVAGKDILEEDAKSIGRAFGTLLQRQNRKTVSVGRDCRLTSESFSAHFISGILSTGCDVIDIGLCPTPVLYFSIQHLNLEGGAMVTASHNPPEYNGFKLMSGLKSRNDRTICADCGCRIDTSTKRTAAGAGYAIKGIVRIRADYTG